VNFLFLPNIVPKRCFSSLSRASFTPYSFKQISILCPIFSSVYSKSKYARSPGVVLHRIAFQFAHYIYLASMSKANTGPTFPSQVTTRALPPTPPAFNFQFSSLIFHLAIFLSERIGRVARESEGIKSEPFSNHKSGGLSWSSSDTPISLAKFLQIAGNLKCSFFPGDQKTGESTLGNLASHFFSLSQNKVSSPILTLAMWNPTTSDSIILIDFLRKCRPLETH